MRDLEEIALLGEPEDVNNNVDDGNNNVTIKIKELLQPADVAVTSREEGRPLSDSFIFWSCCIYSVGRGRKPGCALFRHPSPCEALPDVALLY